jgi:outer membrane lipoprotein-sorting protein
MRRWKASLILLLVLSLGPASDRADGQEPDPVSELRRLSEAIKAAKAQVRFEADLTAYAFTAKETKVTRFRLKYAYPYKMRECIEAPGATRFVLLEDGTYLWSYFPAHKTVVKEPLRKVDSPFPLCPTEDLDLLMENYELVIRGPVPMGEIQCRIVEFIPRATDRPRREFWLEERWNVPVRVRLTSNDGRPAYILELSDIHWDPGLDEEAFGLKVPQDTRVYEVREQENLTEEETERLIERPLLLPPRIPQGYRRHNIVLRMEGPKRCLQVIYTDGLSSFSVFQEWAGSGKATQPVGMQLLARQYGLMNAVTLSVRGSRAVIVGDIRQDRLIEMAESFREFIRESLRESLGETLRQNPPPP